MDEFNETMYVVLAIKDNEKLPIVITISNDSETSLECLSQYLEEKFRNKFGEDATTIVGDEEWDADDYAENIIYDMEHDGQAKDPIFTDTTYYRTWNTLNSAEMEF